MSPHTPPLHVMQVNVRKLGALGILGVIGVFTNEPALYGLFALFALFAVDRTVEVPVPGGA